MRIDTKLSEDDSERVKTLADETGLQKPAMYTRLVRTGLDIEERRERIKELIVQFMADEKQRYEARCDALKDRYDIDSVEHVDEGYFDIVYEGVTYGFRTLDELGFVNGESIDQSVCPECRSDDIDLDFDALDEEDTSCYSCGSCGHEFDKAGRKGVPDEEAADHVCEFADRYQGLFDYVLGRLTRLLDGVMSNYASNADGEWLGPGLYQYRNGFQSVTVPIWVTDPSRIEFGVDRYLPSYEDFENPLFFRARDWFTADYLELVREVDAVNRDADRVEPVRDERGTRPEVIEVIGLECDAVRLPLRTAGFEVEKVEPDRDDLSVLCEDKVVTWIRVTNDKQIHVEGDDDTL
ncbi:hypothetical protein [Halorarum salinum]|uniref:TFIIB-type zinc ribbon-containing protein n=1 Tax=Halorarum salinum TaxID=2743089 RepID=A0A7D5LBK1_9EURY|nr:hypothetical protein [Halobaculum salinum]QLG62069.1 hypothetical protein HUG12_10150 [Halobaculum salinum]